MRATIELSADGKDAKEALKALAAQREQIQTGLAKLSPASTEISDPRLVVASARTQFEMMRGRPPVGPMPGARVSLTVKADWPLAGATVEERIINATELQAK
jgi:hypothetical protein